MFKPITISHKHILPEKQVCFSCGYNLHLTRAIGKDAQPKEGDISLCFNCGHIMAFTEAAEVRELTDQEIVDIAGNKELIKAQKFIKLGREHFVATQKAARAGNKSEV